MLAFSRYAHKYSWWIAALLILYGSINVIATFPLLSHTSDEPAHVSSGMQWWNDHQYTYEALHPPLARLMAASLLYWAGKDLSVTRGDISFWYQGADILHSHGTYELNLILMRLGVFPFYLISCLLVYGWSRKLFGVESALLSLLVYVTIPTLAAHAGLATTDMGNATMVMAAIMASLHWLKKPGFLSSMLAGGVIALMAATKISAIFYWPVAMTLMAIANYAAGWKFGSGARAFSIDMRHILWSAWVAIIFVLVLGAIYFFSYDEFFAGVQDVLRKRNVTWLFRPLRESVWYFFPVLYFFKTPLAFLCMNAMSVVRTIHDATTKTPHVERVFPLLGAVAIMAISMCGQVNLGVRHVLGIYPLLVVPAGYGLIWLWQQKDELCKPLLRIVMVALLLWQSYDFTRTFPDRLSYYNEAAMWYSSGTPATIAFDSDLDWGQDYLLLAKIIKQNNIKELYGCFWWGGFIRRMDETLKLAPKPCPNEPIHGWIAVGYGEKLWSPPGRFTWLEKYTPQKVGNTMLLYHID